MKQHSAMGKYRIASLGSLLFFMFESQTSSHNYIQHYTHCIHYRWKTNIHHGWHYHAISFCFFFHQTQPSTLHPSNIDPWSFYEDNDQTKTMAACNYASMSLMEKKRKQSLVFNRRVIVVKKYNKFWNW